MRLSWNALLFGLKAKRLEGDIYSVQVAVLGDCEFGPYMDLLRFTKKVKLYREPVEVHHIVNGEHLPGPAGPTRSRLASCSPSRCTSNITAVSAKRSPSIMRETPSVALHVNTFFSSTTTCS